MGTHIWLGNNPSTVPPKRALNDVELSSLKFDKVDTGLAKLLLCHSRQVHPKLFIG